MYTYVFFILFFYFFPYLKLVNCIVYSGLRVFPLYTVIVFNEREISRFCTYIFLYLIFFSYLRLITFIVWDYMS